MGAGIVYCEERAIDIEKRDGVLSDRDDAAAVRRNIAHARDPDKLSRRSPLDGSNRPDYPRTPLQTLSGWISLSGFSCLARSNSTSFDSG